MEDFLPLDLGSADVILGMQWLESLGGMKVNWKTLSMRFQKGGVSILLQGGTNLSTSLVSLKAMWKALREIGEGILLELGNIGVMELPLESSTLTPIQRILDQFNMSFSSLQDCRLDAPRTMLSPYSHLHPLLMHHIVTHKFRRLKLSVL